MSKDKIRFDPGANIEETLKASPEVPKLFERLGLKCADCVAAQVETLRHAALYHGKDLDELIRELNRMKIRA